MVELAERTDTFTEEEVETILNLFANAPECTCESSHDIKRMGKTIGTMPTPCSGEASYRFVWSTRKVDILVCKSWVADFHIFGQHVKSESVILPV